MISTPHSEKPLTTKGKNEASIIRRKACHELKGHSPTRAPLGNFSYISLQNVANSSHEKQKDG